MPKRRFIAAKRRFIFAIWHLLKINRLQKYFEVSFWLFQSVIFDALKADERVVIVARFAVIDKDVIAVWGFAVISLHFLILSYRITMRKVEYLVVVIALQT